VSRVLRHFGDESFQAITCTGTDNTINATAYKFAYHYLT